MKSHFTTKMIGLLMLVFAFMASSSLAQAQETVHAEVDQLPVPPGGMKEFTAYMVKNLKYPKDARKQRIEGTVLVKFVVRSDGTVDATEIVKGIGGGCDEEALRVVVNSGKWTAGVKDGRAVSTQLTLPVEFKL